MIDLVFMAQAYETSKTATCIRKGRQVGAVVVVNDKVVGKGSNGAPKPIDPCITCMRESLKIPSGKQQHVCMAFHAEQEAIMDALTKKIDIKGSTIFTTLYPCSTCAKFIVRAGIKRVVYMYPYSDDLTEHILKEGQVTIDKFKPIKWRV